MTWTPERIAIWRNLTPEERDYDRVMANSYPRSVPGAQWLETEVWKAQRQEMQEQSWSNHLCACHMSAPCSHCTDCPECNCARCEDWHDTAGGEICPMVDNPVALD